MQRARLTSRRVRERTLERGCHLEYSIHGKELGSILLRYRMKKYPDLASTRFRTHSVFKNFYSGERIQKVADSYAGFARLHVVGAKETTCGVKRGTHQAVVSNMDARSGRNVNESLIAGTALLKHFIVTPLSGRGHPFHGL